MKPYFFEDGAEENFAEVLTYYRRECETLAGRLYDEIHCLIAEICAAPHLYRVVRCHFSETFPYAVLYVEKPDHIAILAVAHMKRRPGYWHERLR